MLVGVSVSLFLAKKQACPSKAREVDQVTESSDVRFTEEVVFVQHWLPTPLEHILPSSLSSRQTPERTMIFVQLTAGSISMVAILAANTMIRPTKPTAVPFPRIGWLRAAAQAWV